MTEALKVAKDLAVKSEAEEIRGYALEYILKFSNPAAVLAEALGQKPEKERNQLARRVRRQDRGGSRRCLRKAPVSKNGLRNSIGLWTNL